MLFGAILCETIRFGTILRDAKCFDKEVGWTNFFDILFDDEDRLVDGNDNCCWRERGMAECSHKYWSVRKNNFWERKRKTIWFVSIKYCRVWYPWRRKTGSRESITKSNNIKVISEGGAIGKGRTWHTGSGLKMIKIEPKLKTVEILISVW